MSDTRGGYLIIYVMILTFVTMALGLSVLSVVGSQYNYVVDDGYRKNAAHGARACASIVAESLSDDVSFSGFSNQVIFDDLNNSQGQVACTATITNGTGGTKNVDITSTMRRFAADPHPISYEMRAVLQAEGGGSAGGGDYLKGGILAGHAGLYTMIIGSLVTDQINVIGKFYGAYSGNSYVGTSSAPIGKITVANVACGDSTNWPQPCTDQPVTTWVGSSFQSIYADTCAPGQTTGLSNFKGVGLSTNCAVAATSTPGFDKASFTSKMTNTINASTLLNTGTGGCIDKVPIIPGYPQYGVRYNGKVVQIPANTKIVGNLDSYYDGATNITSSSSLQSLCTLKFAGDTYLTGNINEKVYLGISDTAAISPTLVINGTMRISKDHPDLLPNSSGKLLHVISFYSNTPACSNSDTLPSVTQKTCLTNSQAMQSATINATAIPQNPAIVFNSITSTGYNFPGMTLYAYYGTVHTGCTYSTLAAIGGQGVSGGCASVGITSRITTTGTYPTFGDLIPSAPPAWRVVDISRL